MNTSETTTSSSQNPESPPPQEGNTRKQRIREAIEITKKSVEWLNAQQRTSPMDLHRRFTI
ncbi:MAG: hypothetical protein HQM03_21735 [Magnetococcales bacterium]|nr:hypothetical protein [Magnetococcales bacterium]